MINEIKFREYKFFPHWVGESFHECQQKLIAMSEGLSWVGLTSEVWKK
ncbi:MAG: hypothetical protein PHQ66_01720 [Candidatus Nanoarchaeia archaeon]|nr:hypothetical protein [Candidatus Nanoarchaeia archaeon]MDD5357908.1 hypothetical protein [Candidatus Nanoarchaeia archaeon]MDD5588827.1 hypothetical protein [Candidatus Nanoarchaeia archaeon]